MVLSKFLPCVERVVHEYSDNLRFERNHPFLLDWRDWKETVHRYYSYETTLAVQAINKGHAQHILVPHLTKLAYDVGWHSSVIYDLLKTTGEDITYLQKEVDTMTLKHFECECTEETDIWNTKCEYQRIHLISQYLSLLWAHYYFKSPSRRFRKYYNNLQRIILSLSLDRLLSLDVSLIQSPPKIQGLGRNLLKQLYERAYFDNPTTQELALNAEYLKHFRVQQQGGAFQSVSAFIPKRVFKIAIDLFRRYPDLTVTSQGLTLNHDVKISDESIDELRSILAESQTSFMQSLNSTIVQSAKHVMVLFLVASTVAIVARSVFVLGSTLIFKLLNLVYGLICGTSEPEAEILKFAKQQSGETQSIPFFPAMILKYVIAPPTETLTKLWKSHQTDLVMRRIGYLGDPKIHKGVESIIEWVRKMIMSTVNWYRQEILGIDAIESIDLDSCAINTWNEEVDIVVKQYYAGNFRWTESNWSVIMNLYSRGLSFTRQPLFAKYKNDVWRVVSKLGNILEKFNSHMRTSTTIRNPPVTIYLQGGSGVGKSSLTYPFAVEILKGIFTKERSGVDLKKYWKSLIYMRSAEQEFWDGYENQLVTVFDDFNQLVDSSSNPNLELFEIIRASNCFPYPLHMASLDQKANTTFNSKIIIVSSNLEKPQTSSLNFPTALERRFDICVKVSRKPGVVIEEGKFDPSIYELQTFDMQTGQPLDFVSYKDLVYESVTKYFDRKGFVDSVDAYINDVLKDYNVEGTDLPMAQQQGWAKVLGTTARNVTSYAKSIKEIAEIAYLDLKSSFKDDELVEDMHFLGKLSQYFKLRAQIIQDEWQMFKLNHPYMVKCIMFIGIILSTLAVLKLFISLTGDSKKKEKLMSPKLFVKGESYSPSAIKVAKKEGYSPQAIKTAKKESYSAVQVRPVRAEGVKDLNAAEILMKVMRTNVYKMHEVSTDTSIGHCIFLKGQIVCMPRHYVDSMEQAVALDLNSTVRFENVFLDRAFEIHTDELLDSMKTIDSPNERGSPVVSRDLMCGVVNTSIYHADATDYFANKDSLSFVDLTSVVLPVLVNNNVKKSTRPVLMLRYSRGRSALSRVESLSVTDESERVVRYVRDAWQYEMDTQPTECGAPLIVRNTQINPGKIIGLHIAGIEGAGYGFSTPVYREDVLRMISLFSVTHSFEQKRELELDEYPTQQCQVPDAAVFLRHGGLKKPVAQPVKTKIQPSLIYGKIQEPKTKPCLLKEKIIDGETWNPRTFRINKLGNAPIAIRQNMIDTSRDALIDEISSTFSRSEFSANFKPRYTFEEACLGIDGEEYVNSLKRTTSPGFPFIQMKGFENRKKIFGDDVILNTETPQAQELKRRVLGIIEQASQGIVLDHYFCDTLKDERKPIHKAHKTRLFSAGPLDYLIACKMYFNGIVALLQQNRNRDHISVGTNAYSQDWGEIARVLERKSRRMVAGDFEGFDASQHQRLLTAAGEVLIELSKRFLGSTEEDTQVMRVLLVSLFNSFHISGREVYQWTHSLPSGHYLTAVLNSVFVNISFGIVWQLATGECSYMNARQFWKECGIVAYGDDHIVSIPESRLEVFNQMNLPSLFKIIGLGYTMEDKDATATEFARPLHQISYLKRGFRYDEIRNRWLAPLSMDVILETPMWMHQNPDPQSQTIENCEWSLRELALHPKDVWNQWFPKINGLMVELGHYTQFTEYERTKAFTLSQQLEM